MPPGPFLTLLVQPLPVPAPIENHRHHHLITMTTTSPPYQYGYDSAQLGCHHDFLMPPLLSLLAQLPQRKKLRVLDLGCGNGSLSHAMAQRGYEVVGLEESPSGVAIAQRHFPDCQFIQGSLYSPPSSC